MNHIIKEKNVHNIFLASIILKGFNSFLELLGGILLFFRGTVTKIIPHLISKELIEDPTDFVAIQLKNYLPLLSVHAQLLGAVYLLIHGVIKLFLIIALLKKKLWAYPTAIYILFIFIVYQLYRFSHNHSTFLILLSLFDLFIIFLTFREYRRMKRGLPY